MNNAKKFMKKAYDILDRKPIVFILALSFLLNCFIEIMGRRSFNDFLFI